MDCGADLYPAHAIIVQDRGSVTTDPAVAGGAHRDGVQDVRCRAGYNSPSSVAVVQDERLGGLAVTRHADSPPLIWRNHCDRVQHFVLPAVVERVYHPVTASVAQDCVIADGPSL